VCITLQPTLVLSLPDQDILLEFAWGDGGKPQKFSFRMNGDPDEILTQYHQITYINFYNKRTEIQITDKAENKEIIKL
jgi:hypothetical protein